MDCPYYEKVQGPIARDFVRGYCQGYPTVEMMVPSLMEEKNYCLKPDGYLKCPLYLSQLTQINLSKLSKRLSVKPWEKGPLLPWENITASNHLIKK